MEYLKMFSIEKYANSPAGSLPYGQQRRLEIARAIATKPRLLMLDEPAAGMNNEECLELTELIKEIRKKLDLTIMIIEHHIEVIRRLSDYVYVINLGSVLKHGTPEEVLKDPEVIKAYLGEKRGARNVNA
jgi:branched-chain amino acid transport system ATP-binding protein